MKFHLMIFVLLCLTALSAADFPPETTARFPFLQDRFISPPPVAAVRPREHDLADDFTAMIRMIEKESPALYRKLNALPRRETLSLLMKQLDTGIKIFDMTAMKSELQAILADGAGGKDQTYPGRLIAGNRILYLRLDSLNAETVRQFHDDCVSSARLERKPLAVILDLRNATGNDYSLLPEITAWFLPGAIPPILNGLYRTAPVIVLTGAKTSGAPELLAILLERAARGGTLGEAGAGHVFPTRRAHAAGTTWLVPEIPEEHRLVSPYPHAPMISVKAYPQTSYKELSSTGGIDRDAALRRAVDLILSLHALGQ